MGGNMFSTKRGATSALELGAESLSHMSFSCQRRYLSGRKISYPTYPFNRLTSTRKAKHDSNLKYAMRQFLGPKNFKGEYIYNRYFAVPSNHEPKYIRPEIEKGEALVDPVTGKKVLLNPDNSIRMTDDLPPKNSRFRQLQPFPGNKFCTTNVVLSEDIRQSIYHMLEVEKKSAQEVSRAFNLKIPRIEAVAKLVALEKTMEKHNRISPETSKMADVMYKMFPVFNVKHKENLSEIPVPAKALSSRILTIAESQPFGPIDAAKILELEPAAETLEKLGRLGDHSAGHSSEISRNTRKVVYGEVLEGDRFKFRFVSKPVGQVGFRYGSGNRDNRKDRKIGFDKLGRMVYL